MTSKGPAHRVQSATIEYGFPQGHLGHLTEAEEQAFAEFKQVCASKGVYTPGNGQQAASHDEATLLRFLRARRFVVPDALQQFVATEEWRKANELDKLYETIDVDQYEQTRLLVRNLQDHLWYAGRWTTYTRCSIPNGRVDETDAASPSISTK